TSRDSSGDQVRLVHLFQGLERSWVGRQKSRIPSGLAACSYLAALAPAFAATPSCWPVPPLAPMAPMILPFTVMGTPPSDATGFSGKVMNAVFPAANWSANVLLGRRNITAVRALPWEIRVEASWVPSIFSK